MAATISYRSKKPEKDLILGAPSGFMVILENAFYQLPVTLRQSDFEKLRAMMFASTEADYKQAFKELMEALEVHDEIEVFATY